MICGTILLRHPEKMSRYKGSNSDLLKFPRNIFLQHLCLRGNVSKTEAKMKFLLVCNFIAFILGDLEVYTQGGMKNLYLLGSES